MKSLHRKRAQIQQNNPVIGYHIVDRTCRVIGPPGTKLDPAFGSVERALAAAERYGRRADVALVVELHMNGVLGLIEHEPPPGDIMLDGQAARQFVEACRRRGIWLKQAACAAIDETELEAIYSSRALLGR